MPNDCVLQSPAHPHITVLKRSEQQLARAEHGHTPNACPHSAPICLPDVGQGNAWPMAVVAVAAAPSKWHDPKPRATVQHHCALVHLCARA